jgi:hypothetical protein
VQPDPTIHLWMHDQELKRTMRANALERTAREANAQAKREGYPVGSFRVSKLRSGLNGLRRVLRPAGTGSA